MASPHPRCVLEVDGVLHDVHMEQVTDLSIPLDFFGAQPEAFHLGAATATPIEVEGFIGEVARGGPVNCFQVTLWPHGNGTHTETVGHITSPPPAIRGALTRALIPATLLSVELAPLATTDESYPDGGAPEDRVVTAHALAASLDAMGGCEQGWFEALILRTRPNPPSKRARKHSGNAPGYLTREAMEWVRARGVEHLLVDLPSVDRDEDGGQLWNHHCFWGLEPGCRDPSRASGPARTITEMIFVPDDLQDASFVLTLQVPPFILDAAPSRPLIYGTSPRSSSPRTLP